MPWWSHYTGYVVLSSVQDEYCYVHCYYEYQSPFMFAVFFCLFNFIYRKAAQKWHPDNFQGDEKKIAEKKFIDIAAAKEVLTDPGKPNFIFKLATQIYVQCFGVLTFYIWLTKYRIPCSRYSPEHFVLKILSTLFLFRLDPNKLTGGIIVLHMLIFTGV